MVYATSQKGIDLIKSFEGCRLTAYKCPAGVWTIGYGHTAGVFAGQTITNAQAELFLKSDLEKFEKAVINTNLNLNQNQFDALVSFAYNCGAGNLVKLVKGRTVDQIADKLLLYNKANGKVLAGLTRRRTAERNLYLSACKKEEYPTLKIGSKGIYVTMLQTGLNGAGLYNGVISGVFEETTEEAVIRWQDIKNLKKDGVCGQKTWASFGM